MRKKYKKYIGQNFERLWPSNCTLNQPRHVEFLDYIDGIIVLKNRQHPSQCVSVSKYIFKKYYTNPYTKNIASIINAPPVYYPYQAWIVANNKKLVKAYDDKIYHTLADAQAVKNQLDNTYGTGMWTIYEIGVEIF
jgi:hypothetical protein